MKEQTSAAEIGQYGYAHWTDKPVTLGVHTVALVPQSIVDGWEAFCSCGEWRCFIDFYEIKNKDDLLARLKERHALHAADHPPEEQ